MLCTNFTKYWPNRRNIDPQELLVDKLRQIIVQVYCSPCVYAHFVDRYWTASDSLHSVNQLVAANTIDLHTKITIPYESP